MTEYAIQSRVLRDPNVSPIMTCFLRIITPFTRYHVTVHIQFVMCQLWWATEVLSRECPYHWLGCTTWWLYTPSYSGSSFWFIYCNVLCHRTQNLSLECAKRAPSLHVLSRFCTINEVNDLLRLNAIFPPKHQRVDMKSVAIYWYVDHLYILSIISYT